MEEHEVLEFQAAPTASPGATLSVHSHTISCFNAAATLCGSYPFPVLLIRLLNLSSTLQR